MSKPEPSFHVWDRALIPSEAGCVASPTLAPAFAMRIRRLVSLNDGLHGDVNAVWNEAPDVLVMLAEWGDALEVQGEDLRALQSQTGRPSYPEGMFRRLGRDVAREAAAGFSKKARLRDLLRHGQRFLDAQAAAAPIAVASQHRTLLECHRVTTIRHLGRLRRRVGPIA